MFDCLNSVAKLHCTYEKLLKMYPEIIAKLFVVNVIVSSLCYQ